MSDLHWLKDEQMARLEPYFPKSYGRPRGDDRRVLSGIIFVNRNGLRWRDAPRELARRRHCIIGGSAGAKKVYSSSMMEGLSARGAESKTIMIDATYLKAHRPASSLRVKGGGLTLAPSLDGAKTQRSRKQYAPFKDLLKTVDHQGRNSKAYGEMCSEPCAIKTCFTLVMQSQILGYYIAGGCHNRKI